MYMFFILDSEVTSHYVIDQSVIRDADADAGVTIARRFFFEESS
jgi:hypothetical protein